MGDLSSRVLNMRFMKKSSSAANNLKEEKDSRLHDNSEWTLPSDIVNKLKRSQNDSPSIGYGGVNIFNLTNNNSSVEPGAPTLIGKKAWGEQKCEELDLGITKLKDSKNDSKVQKYNKKPSNETTEIEPSDKTESSSAKESPKPELKYKKRNNPKRSGIDVKIQKKKRKIM